MKRFDQGGRVTAKRVVDTVPDRRTERAGAGTPGSIGVTLDNRRMR